MLNNTQLKELIIRPVLDDLNMYSDDAVELLVFTCAAESNGGEFLKQVKGPALGIYQMEPATHNDIWNNYLKHRLQTSQIMAMKFDCPTIPYAERMIHDLRYATAMARLHYRRVKYALPDRKDGEAMWSYYKEHYNTPLGKAKKSHAFKAYRQMTGIDLSASASQTSKS
jgi:hypothetical protein